MEDLVAVPGDPPVELVDRAYAAGAHATSAASAAPATRPDRRGAIRTLGIILIVLGGICALMAVIMVATMSLMKDKGPPGAAIIIGFVVYGIPAANLLVTGIGSVKLARWARRATLISAGIWLPLMLLAIVAMFAAPGMGTNERALAAVIMVPLSLVVLALPVTLLVVYTRPSVRATFERGRQAP